MEEAYKVITMLKGLNAIISPELEQYAENVSDKICSWVAFILILIAKLIILVVLEIV